MQGDNGYNFFQWVKDGSSTSTTSKSTKEERKDCKLCIVREIATSEIGSMVKVKISIQHRLNFVLIFINTLLVMVILILVMKWPFFCKELKELNYDHGDKIVYDFVYKQWANFTNFMSILLCITFLCLYPFI